MTEPASKVSILGTSISTLGFAEALDVCVSRAKAGGGGYVCFANVHSITEGTRNDKVQCALNHSFLSVADGMPLVWVSKLKQQAIALSWIN